jgi:hypothetical protein
MRKAIVAWLRFFSRGLSAAAFFGRAILFRAFGGSPSIKAVRKARHSNSLKKKILTKIPFWNMPQYSSIDFGCIQEDVLPIGSF